MFVAPRGLITILLFLSIEPSQTISLVNKSLIIQVIILSALLMMIGLMVNKPQKIVEILFEISSNNSINLLSTNVLCFG